MSPQPEPTKRFRIREVTPKQDPPQYQYVEVTKGGQTVNVSESFGSAFDAKEAIPDSSEFTEVVSELDTGG